MKLVVASAVDGEGEQMYPRKWNSDFINAPKVKKQHTPSFTATQISDVLAKTEGQARMLLMLAAASGLRLGELLGLSVSNVVNNGTTLRIKQQSSRGKTVSERLKTEAAYREVDIHSEVAAQLTNYLGDRKTGLVFATSHGTAFNPSNLRNRELYPLLESLGIDQAGFHAFRRYRVTYLRKHRAPEDLIRFWLGHEGTSVTDGYSQLKEDVEHRKTVAESVGVGFRIPIVQSVQSAQKEVAVAA